MLDLKKMSKALIPLSLMTMGVAFAESEIADSSYSNCCPTNCCKPCCVPQPKKCIDCECYNPQFYDLQCDWGVFVTADFLYWYAHESNLEYANIIQYTRELPEPGVFVDQQGYIVSHSYLKSEWKPGVRVGLGMNTDCDGWDLLLNWTYFKNKSSDSTFRAKLAPDTDTTQDGLVLGVNNPWASSIDVEFPLFTQVLAPRVSAKWTLIFNQIDLEFGKKYWISKCFTVRPYTGIRGAWTHTNFRVDSHSEDVKEVVLNDQSATLVTARADQNKFKNKYWGVGLLGGLQPQFIFGDWCGCGVFSLYGNVEGALIWGKFKGRNALSYEKIRTVTAGTEVLTVRRAAFPIETDSFDRMQGILDLGIGLRWEEHWCCDRYSTSIDLGWEHHYWFDFGLYHRTINGVYVPTTPETHTSSTPLASNNFVTNLGFGGLVIRFRFDF